MDFKHDGRYPKSALKSRGGGSFRLSTQGSAGSGLQQPPPSPLANNRGSLGSGGVGGGDIPTSSMSGRRGRALAPATPDFTRTPAPLGGGCPDPTPFEALVSPIAGGGNGDRFAPVSSARRRGLATPAAGPAGGPRATPATGSRSMRRERLYDERSEHVRPVTVFGFPPEKASSIVHRFQKFGEIVRRKDGGENYLHILYKVPVEAQMALNQNGKVFDGVMIGVVDIPDEMLHEWNEDEHRGSSYAGSSASAFGRRGARARRAGTTRRDVEAKPRGRARSFCNRVMEYVFNF